MRLFIGFMIKPGPIDTGVEGEGSTEQEWGGCVSVPD